MAERPSEANKPEEWSGGPRLSRRAMLGLVAAAPAAALAAQLNVGGVPLPRLGFGTASAQSSTTLVRNASLVLTMDPTIGEGPLGMLGDADVLMRDGAIVGVGKNLVEPGAAVLDVAGKIVMPGLINLHTHGWQAVIRGGCADMDLLGWMTACNQPSRTFLTPPDVYSVVRLSALDNINTGVTTVIDYVHAFPFDQSAEYAQALDESGVRFIYAITQPATEVNLVLRIKKELLDPLPRATAHVTSVESLAAVDSMRLTGELATDQDMMIELHVLERIEQRVDQPIQALDRAGVLGSRLLMAHAIHLTDDEVNLVAERDVRAAHNPLSNMRLASGIMRLPELQGLGMKVGLGLDGGTNDTSDMFNNMRAAVGLQRVVSQRADVYPTVTDVLRMATIGGAEAIGMADRIGSLTPGKRADLIVVNPEMINFAPRFDWLNQLVFNTQPVNVEYVFVDGEALKAGGELVGVDPVEVVRAAEAAAADVREGMGR